MLDDNLRATVLRCPQGGTPDASPGEEAGRNELVGDVKLLDIGLESAGHAVLCGVLLRTQLRAYRRFGHIICYADDYVLRKIRSHGRRGTLPNCYARCMRCGCIALLLDWCASQDLADDPLMAGRRFGSGKHIPVDTAFYKECTGEEKARNALILMD